MCISNEEEKMSIKVGRGVDGVEIPSHDATVLTFKRPLTSGRKSDEKASKQALQ